MALDDALRSLAETQHALVSVEQFRALGGSPAARRHRLAGPDWEAPTDRVLRLVGAPHTVHQRLMIAALDAGGGAAISHGSAAALWRLPGFDVRDVEVSRQRNLAHRPSSVAQIHRPRALSASHVTERHAIPVTTLGRTLFDLAERLHPSRLERLVDTVVSKSPSVLPTLHAMLGDLQGKGRGGVGHMRAVLADRPPGSVAPASGLEARFARLLADAGELPLERQVDLGGHEWIGRVDFLDRRHGIVFEVDSDLHHTSPTDRAHDRRRDEALLAAGWRAVVRVTEDEIWRRPYEAVARVRSARRDAPAVLVAESSALGRDSATRRVGA